MAINKYILRQEGILGRNAAITEVRLVDTISFILVLVISLSFAVMAIHDFGK